MSLLFFPLKWDSDLSNVRIYGLKLCENNKFTSCCLIINNWPSRLLLEIDVQDPSFEKKLDFLRSSLKLEIKKQIVQKTKLLGTFIEPDGSKKKFSFFEIYFKTKFDVFKFIKFINENKQEYQNFIYYEDWVELWFQLALKKELPITNWIKIEGYKKVEDIKKISICDEEYIISSNNIFKYDVPKPPPPIPLLAFDIEVYSHIDNAMPKAENPEDQVFMISMVFINSNEKEPNKIVLITRCNVNPKIIKEKFNIEEVEIIKCESETILLEKFNETIVKYKPFFIFGYNNMMFDCPYLIERGKLNNCMNAFKRCSMNKYVDAQLKDISWSSSAYKQQHFIIMQGEGFSWCDLYYLILKDYKLTSYKLNSVSEHFLKNEQKHDITPKRMNKCFFQSLQTPNDSKCITEMSIIANYCIQDSLLVVKLLYNLKYIGSLIALSDLTNCKLEDLTMRGSMHKNLSLIVRFCWRNNVVVQKKCRDGREIETYRGATVFEPLHGLWNNVTSYDFASLYPSIMLTYNLCPSTYVEDAENSNIPLDKCEVYEWDDHVGCEHDERVIEKRNIDSKLEVLKQFKNTDDDVNFNDENFTNFVDLKNYQNVHKLANISVKDQMCCHRRYVFYKGYPGIFPQIVRLLIDARKVIKQKLKNKQKELENAKNDPELMLILQNEVDALDSEQKAVKVINNSLYGFAGAKVSPFPSIPIAACVTFLGRTNIQIASQVIQNEFNGIRIYGDTDSNYVKLDGNYSYKELFEKACFISKYVSDKFPETLNIEFEGEIFASWLIVNKKQYCYKILNEDGTVKDKIGAKGLIIVKRDNCKWVRETYEAVIKRIFAKETFEEIVNFILNECLRLIESQAVLKSETFDAVDISKLLISKAVNSWGEGKIDYHLKSMGDYKVRLPKGKVFTNKMEEYKAYQNSLPAHVQMAIKLNENGCLVTPGERLEFLISSLTFEDEKMCKKYCSREMFENNRWAYKADFYFYIKSLLGHVDVLLNIVFKRKASLYKKCNNYHGKKCLHCFLLTNYRSNFIKGYFFPFLNQMKLKNEIHKILINQRIKLIN